MKALFLVLMCMPSLVFASVSVPRAKQYAWFTYDVARDGGQSVPHSIGLFLPAGAILTNLYVYINTKFAASGTESLGLSCEGSEDLMAYSSIKNVAINSMYGAAVTGNTFNGGAAPIPAVPTVLDFSQGYASIPAACEVKINVRGDSLYTPYTAGKLTGIIEYFKL